jgi:hypothetical protein
MPSSYREINYSIRPAKAIERKMLCDAFRRVSHIAKLSSYRYIGFGSPFFNDFLLIHRALGLTKLIDIEKQEHDSPRFRFNRPFRCVKIKFGLSTKILPTLSWRDRTIAWLDYDGTLDNDVLDDVATFATRARSGSILVVSVNANDGGAEDLPAPERPARRFQLLRERLGGKVPRTVRLSDDKERDLVPTDLSGWGLAKLYARIITNQISDARADRNGTEPSDRRVGYRQLFHFHYKDGARMLTVGGILFDEKDRKAVDACRFEDIDYVVPDGGEPYVIDVPSITLKEARYIDRHLPKAGQPAVRGIGVPEGDVKKYAKLYRWYPAFAEAEL